MHDYASLIDEEVALLAQKGDAEAFSFLLDKYKNFVRKKAHVYFLVGADHEDIVQEGMIGLFKAARDYRRDKASFHTFAELCVTRQILTAIKRATRQKQIPLNFYVSLNRSAYNGEDERTMMDVIPQDRASDPEAMMIAREKYAGIKRLLQDGLSPLEQQVIRAYLDGRSYQDIAQEVGRSQKSIDNALQRIRRKLEKLEAEEA